MSDGRRFVFVYPTGYKFGKAASVTGIYSSMQFCYGGRSRMPFPINIECDTVDNAQHLLSLMQPIADRYHTTPPVKLLSILEGLQEWKNVCSFMDSLTSTFFAVSLGWKIGIFIARAGAEDSLNKSKDQQFRTCDQYSTFHGAYASMATAGQLVFDYIGPGTGPEERSEAPPAPPAAVVQGVIDPPLTPHRRDRSATPGPLHQGPWPNTNPQTPRRPRLLSEVGPRSHSTPSAVHPVQRSGTLHHKHQSTDPFSPSSSGKQPLRYGEATVGQTVTADYDHDHASDNEPNYGSLFYFYLRTHRFNDHAAHSLHAYFQQSQSEEEFIDALQMGRDVEVTSGEASFIFFLMMEHPEGPGDSL
ncbi:hypothetical protein Hypma_005886 [Hypsizygus marmoreus]|uniref:Uncharacterized protein n=1 Tax=Hypsizygus marmoreus TaxID=39966 RepID=A0A369K7Z7_HYPMA|nr:hypothetical protein Hypma_005886 [Hypsizygus marmoreus]